MKKKCVFCDPPTKIMGVCKKCLEADEEISDEFFILYTEAVSNIIGITPCMKEEIKKRCIKRGLIKRRGY